MSKRVLCCCVIAALSLLVAFAAGASAQEFRGSVAGTVTDPAGAVVPNASVTIKNVATNIEATQTTNDEGGFSFPLLQPGTYSLTITSQGFNTAVRDQLVVNVADRLSLDIGLEIGASETVNTIASSDTLETGSVTTGSIINERQIQELPLAEGTAYQLATLAPGIAYTGNPQFVGPTSNGNLAAFRSNGATGSNQITLDGAPNYAFDGGVGFSPPADAVQEFRVQTSAFDAQQGYSAGATVNVAIRSGTNAFRGALNYFNRDRSRTANNFFGNRSGEERPERTYHRFGGTVSGPVFLPRFGEGGRALYNGRDRTFFLFSYERLKDNIGEPELLTVPTLAERNGDFSALLNLPTPIRIYDPATARMVGTNVVRTAFDRNIIPANRISPVARAVLNLYPLPNLPGNADGTLNYFSNQNRIQDYRSYLGRIDHNINENNRIFGKVFHSFNPEDRYNFAGVVNGIPVTQGFEYRTNDGGTINYTSTLNSNIVFDIRGSLNRFVQERRPAATYNLASLGFSPQALAVIGGNDYLPRFDIRNFATLGAERADFNEGRIRPFYLGAVQPTVTQVIGDHTARYGYDLRVLRENFSSEGYNSGRFLFDGTFTREASNSGTPAQQAIGRDLAAFLLGIPTASGSSLIENPISYSVQSIYHGFFVQDDWRVTPKLTLNLGLRYELELGLTERFNRILRGFDPTTTSPLDAAVRARYTTLYNANATTTFANLPTPDQFRVLGGLQFADANNRAAFDADKTNIQPRIGAAYQLDERTVLRGGFGIFAAPFQIEAPLQTGFSGNTLFVPTNNNGLTFTSTLDNPFPSGLTTVPGSSLGLLTNIGNAIGTSGAPIFPVDRRNAKFARFVVGIQRELPGRFIAEANFVHSRGYDLAVNRDINFVPRSFLGADPASDIVSNTFLSANVANPFQNIAPVGSPLRTAANITRAQLLLPFPQFTSDVFVQEYDGTNRYNSLQLQLNRRFAGNGSLTTTYTYSKLREQVNYLNPSDTELEDRISPVDRPHRFTLAGVYELPIGRGRAFGGEMPRVLAFLIGGYPLNGTYEIQSGEPFLLTQPLYFNGDVTQIVSRVGQYDEQGRKYGIDIPAFDTSGLIRLTGFGLRNVPSTLDNLRNQRFLNVNLSLTKNFRFGEIKRLQIRAEALNAFNTPYFGAGLVLDPNNASFGFVSAQRNNPRDIQLGAKFYF